MHRPAGKAWLLLPVAISRNSDQRTTLEQARAYHDEVALAWAPSPNAAIPRSPLYRGPASVADWKSPQLAICASVGVVLLWRTHRPARIFHVSG